MLQPWRGPPFEGVENTLFRQAHGGTSMTVRITGENFTPRELKSERELDLNPGWVFKKEGGNIVRMEDVCAPLYCCHVCCMLSVCCVCMICVILIVIWSVSVEWHPLAYQCAHCHQPYVVIY